MPKSKLGKNEKWPEPKPYESKWLKKLEQKDVQLEIVPPLDQKSRLYKLRHLFDEDSDQQDEEMDKMAVGVNLDQFLGKVDEHLSHEVRLIEEWEKSGGRI